MAVRIPSTRRDRRYVLRQGCATFEFNDPTAQVDRRKMPLVRISASGVEFRIDDCTEAPSPGTHLECVTLRIGDCVLEGEALIRMSQPLPGGGVDVGCLFYPGNSSIEERLVVFLAGIDAAQQD